MPNTILSKLSNRIYLSKIDIMQLEALEVSDENK